MNIGERAIDAAVAEAFLAALRPAACGLPEAAERSSAATSGARQRRRQVDEARFEAVRPNAATAPSTPRTGWSPAAWKPNGHRVRAAPMPKPSSPAAGPPVEGPYPGERDATWPSATTWANLDAPTTADKDRKQLLRTLLKAMNIAARRDDPDPHARLVLRWKGGAVSELTVPLRRPQPKSAPGRDHQPDHRLAIHYPDAVIAGILNRQGRHPPRGMHHRQ